MKLKSYATTHLEWGHIHNVRKIVYGRVGARVHTFGVISPAWHHLHDDTLLGSIDEVTRILDEAMADHWGIHDI